MSKTIWTRSDFRKHQQWYDQASSLYKELKKLENGYQKAAAGLENKQNTLIQKKLKKTFEISSFLTWKKEDSFTAAIQKIYFAEEYKKKFLLYKRYSIRLNEELSSTFYYSSFMGPDLHMENLKEKIRLTDQLVACADKLFESYSPVIEQEFKLAERHLMLRMDGEDFAKIYLPGNTKADNLFRFYKTSLRHAIVCIGRKMLRNRMRDFLTQLREIVRFHFKNMDDETDSDEIFNTTFKNSSLSKIILTWIPIQSLKYSRMYSTIRQ